MVHQVADTVRLITRHLMACFKQPNYRIDQQDQLNVWLTRYAYSLA
jgi:hypothetical protein